MAKIKCYGVFWRLDLAELDDFWIYGWKPKNQKWVYEPDDAKICINDQAGVYMLHNADREVLYVGQSKKLGPRLWAHTRNDNRHRWTHFSWFSIDDAMPADDEGYANRLKSNRSNKQIVDKDDEISAALSISTFEALLITAIEPRLNKRGGDWSDTEKYLQFSYHEDVTKHELQRLLSRERLQDILKES